MALMLLDNDPNSGGFGLSGISGRFSSTAPGQGVSNIVTNGLIYYLDAGRTASYPGSGSSWNDITQYHAASTLYGGPTFDGTGNGSLVFDGIDDYASVISGEGRTTFTIGLWVKTTTNASNGESYLRPVLIGKEYPGPNVGDFSITINNGNVGYWTDLGNFQSSTPINDGTWKYVVVASNGTTAQMYLNGQLMAGSSLGVNTLSPYAFEICGNSIRNLRTAASIGSVTFYSRELNSSEILQNYTAGWGVNAYTQPATTIYNPLDLTNSIYFDGSGDYLTLPDDSSLELANSSFTIEMWVKTTNSTQYATLYSRTPFGFNSGMWSLMMNHASTTAGDLAVYVADYNGGSPLLASTGVNIRDGNWHHIALVRNSSSWNLYVDGASCANNTWSGTIANLSAGPYVGRDQNYVRYYTGYISNLRVKKGTAVYTSNFVPPLQPLQPISGTVLLAAQRDTIIDISSFNHTITAYGNVSVSTDTPF
jgi:hypothetical protein